MKTVNTELPLEEQNEDELTIGDSILMQFYYGNYTDAIEMMKRDYISPEQLATYLEDRAEEYDMSVSNMFSGHFTLSLFASIGQSYNS